MMTDEQALIKNRVLFWKYTCLLDHSHAFRLRVVRVRTVLSKESRGLDDGGDKVVGGKQKIMLG